MMEGLTLLCFEHVGLEGGYSGRVPHFKGHTDAGKEWKRQEAGKINIQEMSLDNKRGKGKIIIRSLTSMSAKVICEVCCVKNASLWFCVSL